MIFNSNKPIYDSKGIIMGETALEIYFLDIAPIDAATKEQIKQVGTAAKSTGDSVSIINYATLLFSSSFFLIANSVELIDIIQSYKFLNIRLP